MTGVAPGVRTHSVRSVVVEMDGSDVLVCRGCGEQWPASDDAETIERQTCGTRAPDPGSEAETNG